MSGAFGIGAFGIMPFGGAAPVAGGNFPPTSVTTVTSTLPSYLYQQYADDDNLQGFVAAYNAMAQQYIDWFNAIGLPIYTGPLIVGALLDWVGSGIYGISRPTLSYTTYQYSGPFNTLAGNTLGFNEVKQISSSTVYVATDDIYKRVLTWNLYKGDGRNFTITWLKRRIFRFLMCVNGTDCTIDETYQISIVITGTIVAITINPGVAPLTDALVLKAAIQDGAVILPFQYTYTVTVT